jgi:tetratricopeptide (TPR) repeat protein
MLPFIITAFLTAAGAAPGDWFDHYEKGVRLIEQGQAAAARPELEASLALHDAEGLQVPTRAHEYIDYLPHLYLAIAEQMSGDVDGARAQLALAEKSGAAQKSEVGRPLLVAYELLLSGGNATGRRPAYATYTQTKPVLTDAEFKTLRNDVLTKCDIGPDMKLADAPWYARYELGLQLEQKGDYVRALGEFIDAVAQSPSPRRRARTYGMWLIDYYPYFHIARAHVRLENWQCAKNALDISQRLGEIADDAPEVHEYLAMQDVTARKVSGK